ncbi:MAG: hypothetical protein JWM73_1889 [Solirubrobacterales bacterium]|nr:hypothetical protein [Solirubrobacterales bacterium]
MSTDNEPTEPPETRDDVAEGVTNRPRGSGDRDETAIEAGEDRLEQAGGGH